MADEKPQEPEHIKANREEELRIRRALAEGKEPYDVLGVVRPNTMMLEKMRPKKPEAPSIPAGTIIPK